MFWELCVRFVRPKIFHQTACVAAIFFKDFFTTFWMFFCIFGSQKLLCTLFVPKYVLGYTKRTKIQILQFYFTVGVPATVPWLPRKHYCMDRASSRASPTCVRFYGIPTQSVPDSRRLSCQQFPQNRNESMAHP